VRQGQTLFLCDIAAKGCVDAKRQPSDLLQVVGGEVISDKFARSVGVEVARHVIGLGLHVSAHLVETRGGDHVAGAVDLPSDGSVLGADLVVAAGTGGGTSVVGNVGAEVTVDDHTADEVGVVKGLVVDNCENLTLDTNGVEGGERIIGVEHLANNAALAENTIVEGGLVLVNGTALTGAGVGPVDLVGLTDFHASAVLPVVRLGELDVSAVVVLALESFADLAGEQAAVGDGGGTRSGLVELTGGVVLSTKVPVDVDGAETLLVVRLGDGDGRGLQATDVTLGHVGTGLLEGNNNVVLHAGEVLESGFGLLALAGVGLQSDGGLGGGHGGSLGFARLTAAETEVAVHATGVQRLDGAEVLVKNTTLLVRERRAEGGGLGGTVNGGLGSYLSLYAEQQMSLFQAPAPPGGLLAIAGGPVRDRSPIR